MKGFWKRIELFKLLGSAVLSQALLSAGSFAVGLLLIRHTTDTQYGYYILAWNAVLLFFSLHGAFINPPMVRHLTPLGPEERRHLLGGLLREQTNVLVIGACSLAFICAVLWYAGFIDSQMGPLILTTIAAAFATLQRNFFRMSLLAHRRPFDVLTTDIVYVVLMIVGTAIAMRFANAAAVTMLVMSIAAAASGFFTARAQWKFLPWYRDGAPGILRRIAPLAAISTAGAGIHWAFSQGYMYLAAGMLDVAAVAALGATRLLMMPVNLLSTGIGTLMLPLTADWLHRHGSMYALRRLVLFALGMACALVCYFGVLWLLRDWIFEVILRKQFAHRDQLLLLWGLAFLPMVIRDQLLYFLVARERFRQLTSLGFACALISLLAGYVGMIEFGVTGAPLGVFTGEMISLCGIVFLSLRQAAAPFERARVAVGV